MQSAGSIGQPVGLRYGVMMVSWAPLDRFRPKKIRVRSPKSTIANKKIDERRGG
jgi:hypothetical protein